MRFNKVTTDELDSANTDNVWYTLDLTEVTSMVTAATYMCMTFAGTCCKYYNFYSDW